MIDAMTRRGRILTSVAIAGMAAWALWLAPLERPRVVLNDVDAHRVWFSPDGRLLATAEYFGEKGTRLRVWHVADGRPAGVLYDGDEEFVVVIFSSDGKQRRESPQLV